MSTFPKRLIEEQGDSPARRLLESAGTDVPPANLVSTAILTAIKSADPAPSGPRLRDSSPPAPSPAGRKTSLLTGAVLVGGALALFTAYEVRDSYRGAETTIPRSSTGLAKPALVPAPLAETPASPDTSVREEMPSASVTDLPNAPPPAPSAVHRVTAVPAAQPEARADLLREANRLRAAGNWDEAAKTYQKVLDLGPGSPEAYPAEVALGNLDLQRGHAASALARYEHALASQPGGALAEEARWGKARALRAAGRTTEERAALEEFRLRHPDSPLVPVASRRLAEIGN